MITLDPELRFILNSIYGEVRRANELLDGLLLRQGLVTAEWARLRRVHRTITLMRINRRLSSAGIPPVQSAPPMRKRRMTRSPRKRPEQAKSGDRPESAAN